MQVDIGQRHAVGLFGILKADVIEIDGPVLDLGQSVFRASQRAFFAEHLDDTFGGFNRHGNHHEYHGQHHQAHQNLEAVRQHGGHLANIEGQAAAADNGVRTVGQHKDHAGIDAELHHGVVDGHNPLGAGEILPDVFGRNTELFLLIVLAHIGLHDAHGLYILLNRIVQRVVLAEDAAEQRRHSADDQHQADGQQRDGDQEDHGQAPAHDKAHGEREDQHQRAADGDADNHHIGHLHVGDVGRQTGNQAGHREFVDVLERIILNFVEHIFAQITRKTGRCGRTGRTGQSAEDQRNNRHDDQCQAILDNDVHGAAGLHLVDQIGDHEGDRAFQDDLHCDQQRRQNGSLFVLADTAGQDFYHFRHSSFSLVRMCQVARLFVVVTNFFFP